MLCVKAGIGTARLSNVTVIHSAFPNTYCVPGPTSGMRKTEKMLGLSLFSRSFQPRKRGRDVAPKGEHKEICRVLWEPWGQLRSPEGKWERPSGRRRSLDLPRDQDLDGQRKKRSKVLQVERSIVPTESVEKLRGS